MSKPKYEFEIGDVVKRDDNGQRCIITARRKRADGSNQYSVCMLDTCFTGLEFNTTMTLVERSFCSKIKRWARR